jgi:hypothetical protein
VIPTTNSSLGNLKSTSVVPASNAKNYYLNKLILNWASLQRKNH